MIALKLAVALFGRCRISSAYIQGAQSKQVGSAHSPFVEQCPVHSPLYNIAPSLTIPVLSYVRNVVCDIHLGFVLF